MISMIVFLYNRNTSSEQTKNTLKKSKHEHIIYSTTYRYYKTTMWDTGPM